MSHLCDSRVVNPSRLPEPCVRHYLRGRTCATAVGPRRMGRAVAANDEGDTASRCCMVGGVVLSPAKDTERTAVGRRLYSLTAGAAMAMMTQTQRFRASERWAALCPFTLFTQPRHAIFVAVSRKQVITAGVAERKGGVRWRH